MPLPSHLKTLLPNTLDVLRYYQRSNLTTASIDDICQDVGLSERGFGKVIRSLVTKGYVIMDGDQVYRLTDKGGGVAEELAAFDAESGGEAGSDNAASPQLTRRLMVVMPRQLQTEEPTLVQVGFQPLTEQSATLEIVARLSVVNGEPSAPQEATFELTGAATKQDFLVTAGRFAQARVKVEVFQMGPNPGDIAPSGGMYVDVAVTTEANGGDLTAYGTDITIEDRD